MSSHPHLIQPGLRSRYGRLELYRRLTAVDLVAVDIDECLVPGFSQSWLGHRILFQLLRRPDRLADLAFVPQLLSGGAYIHKAEVVRRVTGRLPSDRALMERYVLSMRGIPELYFVRGARAISRRLHPGVVPTLELLGARARLGLVSFGIQVIAEELMRQVNEETGRPTIAFAEANQIAFTPAPAAGRGAFDGYRAPVRACPGDKRVVLEKRLALYGASRPLIIGNSANEGEMAHLARQLDGLSIGIRPSGRDCGHFDLVLSAGTWIPLRYLIEGMLG